MCTHFTTKKKDYTYNIRVFQQAFKDGLITRKIHKAPEVREIY